MVYDIKKVCITPEILPRDWYCIVTPENILRRYLKDRYCFTFSLHTIQINTFRLTIHIRS